MALPFQRRKIHREPASSRRARATQVIVANSIENAAHLDDAEVVAMVDQIVDAMRARTARLCGDDVRDDDADADDDDDDDVG